MWLKKLFGRGFKAGGYAGGDSLRNIDPSGLFRYPPMIDTEDDGKVRIISDGTALGTKVFIGGKEISGVISIEFGEIRANGVVSAKLEFMAVALDMVASVDCSPPDIDMASKG